MSGKLQVLSAADAAKENQILQNACQVIFRKLFSYYSMLSQNVGNGYEGGQSSHQDNIRTKYQSGPGNSFALPVSAANGENGKYLLSPRSAAQAEGTFSRIGH